MMTFLHLLMVLARTKDGAAVDLPPDEDGHELWLRYRPVDINPTFVSISCAHPDSNACSELQQGLSAMSGHSIPASSNAPAADNTVVIRAGNANLTIPSNDSFSLSWQSIGGHRSMVIEGQSTRSVIYGVFKFLRQIQLNGDVSALNLQDAPLTNLRMWNMWDNLDGTVERGYACAEPRKNCSAIWPTQPGKVQSLSPFFFLSFFLFFRSLLILLMPSDWLGVFSFYFLIGRT